MERVYLIKNPSAWMMDELEAFSLYTRFKVIFLRTPASFYQPRIDRLRQKGIEVFVKPFRYNVNIKKILFSLCFVARHASGFLSRYSFVVGVKSLAWFLLINDKHFSPNSSIHAQFATQPALLAHLIKRYYIKRNIKYYFTFHAYDIFFNNRWFHLLARDAERCFSISDYNIRYIKEKWPSIDSAKFEVIRLGAFANPDVGKKVKTNAQFRLGFISWFVEKKGIIYLLEAMKRIAVINSHVKLYIAGDGPQRNEMVKFITDNQLQDRIIYKGKLNEEEKKFFFSEVDAVVLPAIKLHNNQDGIPVVLIEAISYGLPTIATNISGIPEICIDRFNGLLIPEKNTEELVKAIITLSDDEKLTGLFSRNALRLFEKYRIEDNSLSKLKRLNWLN